MDDGVLPKAFRNNKPASMKNGMPVVRLNPQAAVSIKHMNTISKISKRRLASYAIHLLRQEFEKWIKGEPNVFGYEVEVYDGDED